MKSYLFLFNFMSPFSRKKLYGGEPKTYRDYASVIELFEHQLEGYAWNNLAHGQQASETAQKKGKSFLELYDHTHIAENVREFLDYFVPRKVMAGNDFILKTCPRVIRKLLRWMREKELVAFTNDEMKDMCENQLWEDSLPYTFLTYYEMVI